MTESCDGVYAPMEFTEMQLLRPRAGLVGEHGYT
jgi:hypothetical protein